MDALNNVYARLPGRQAGNPLVVTAHLDTVLPARTLMLAREDQRIRSPGIGGNSLGVAALLGWVWMLRGVRAQLESDLRLVANTCEEGLDDLRGVKAVVERFGEHARGYLVLEGTALVHVYHRAIGVKRYRVVVTTTCAGAHTAQEYIDTLPVS